jgi:hypothetical protein
LWDFLIDILLKNNFFGIICSVFISISQGKATHQREGYPLRPELIESAMYLYRATGDPYMLEIGEDILHAIEYSARTECGYATIRDVTTYGATINVSSFVKQLAYHSRAEHHYHASFIGLTG